MKIDRIISIIMLLLERKMMTAPELAKLFEVSTRTIFRDIDVINLAGIPIVTYPGPTGGLGIMEQYRVDKRLFTTSDITSLLIGMGGVHTAMSDSSIRNTLAKIKGMVPQEQLNEIEQLTKQVAIDLTPWKKDTRQESYFILIKKAITEKRLLIIEYSNADKSTTTREIEPYRLLHKGNSWYLQGYCLMRNEFRTFRFYRIEKITPTAKEFVPRQVDFSALDDNFGASTAKVEVLIRFHKLSKKEIIGFWGDGVIESFEDDFYTAKIAVMDNENGYKSIFLMGDKCECLSPDRVRNYVAGMSARIARLYTNK